MRDFLIGWVKDIFGSGLFSDVETILNMNPSDFGNAWNIIEKIYEAVCVPLGSGLVLIYFMVNVIEKSTQQQSIDVEHIIKLLLKLFFGLYLIENGLKLMASIYALSFGLVKNITAQASGDGLATSNFAADVWKELTGEDMNKNVHWGLLKTISPGIFPVFFELIIPWLCSLIMKLVINFVCYTRLIELYLKTAMAPIALSDFFTEGIHSNGWKFVKGYIAIALQAGIIMLAVVVFNAIASDIVSGMGDGYWKFMFKYLALGFATIGVMLKSMSLAKELVGVQ